MLSDDYRENKSNRSSLFKIEPFSLIRYSLIYFDDVVQKANKLKNQMQYYQHGDKIVFILNEFSD